MAVNPGAGAAVSIRNLTKRFRVRKGVPEGSVMGPNHWLTSLLIRSRSPLEQFTAVNDVSFDVRPGECLGLLGRNGAGKTTLLKCITTLLVPDEGSIEVYGYDAALDPCRVRRCLTMIGSGQWVAFDWGLSVRENLQFFATLHGLCATDINERMEQCLEVVRLGDRIDDTPGTLSSGERQRMVLARGLLLDAPLMLMDEPTANLDPRGTADTLDHIRAYLQRVDRKTIIYTTHRMEEAEELCDRVAIMEHGRLVALDSPRNLVRLVSEFDHLEIDFAGAHGGIIAECEKIERVSGVDLVLGSVAGVDATLRLQCSDSEATSAQAVDMLRRLGVEVKAVRSTSPRLGDVILHLTGRGLGYAI